MNFTINKYLKIAGASILGFFVFVFLHNLTSGLLSQLFKTEIEEPVFFILAVIICPLGFIIGMVGNIIQLIFKNISDVDQKK
jgi:hypothetical protein